MFLFQNSSSIWQNRKESLFFEFFSNIEWMLQKILAVMLIGHGLAHISGFLASWSTIDSGYKVNNPSLFSDKISFKGSIGKLFGILWLIALLFLAGSGFSIFYSIINWQILAFVGSTISLLVIILWWKTVPLGAKIGAFFDLILLLYLLIYQNHQLFYYF